MATLADMQTSVDNLKTAVAALEQRVQSAAPTVLQSDLDPLKAEVDQMATQVGAVLNAPAPAA